MKKEEKTAVGSQFFLEKEKAKIKALVYAFFYVITFTK